MKYAFSTPLLSTSLLFLLVSSGGFAGSKHPLEPDAQPSKRGRTQPTVSAPSPYTVIQENLPNDTCFMRYTFQEDLSESNMLGALNHIAQNRSTPKAITLPYFFELKASLLSEALSIPQLYELQVSGLGLKMDESVDNLGGSLRCLNLGTLRFPSALLQGILLRNQQTLEEVSLRRGDLAGCYSVLKEAPRLKVLGIKNVRVNEQELAKLLELIDTSPSLQTVDLGLNLYKRLKDADTSGVLERKASLFPQHDTVQPGGGSSSFGIDPQSLKNQVNLAHQAYLAQLQAGQDKDSNPSES